MKQNQLVNSYRNALFLFLFIPMTFNLVAQESDSIWWDEYGVDIRTFYSGIQSYPLDKQTVWTVDGHEHVILAKNGTIKMYDTDGFLFFEQGIKKIGNLKQLEIINSLKFYLFSEEQQLLCFYDNTLSSIESCIDLSKYRFQHVSLVAYSERTNNFWVFDEVNSSLHQLSLEGKIIQTTSKNLKGQLGAESIVQLIESEGRVYLVAEKHRIYIFDIYGTFLHFIQVPDILYIDVQGENYIICLTSNNLVYMSFDEDHWHFYEGLDVVTMPMSEDENMDDDSVIEYVPNIGRLNIRTFKNTQGYTYFATPNQLIKTMLTE